MEVDARASVKVGAQVNADDRFHACQSILLGSGREGGSRGSRLSRRHDEVASRGLPADERAQARSLFGMNTAYESIPTLGPIVTEEPFQCNPRVRFLRRLRAR